jgi:hypothetical protein
MREVVTVQAGGYANFVGAHFWNLQRGFEEDTLFREGRTELGEPTTTPRLVVCEAPTNLGSLRPGGYQYHQDG